MEKHFSLEIDHWPIVSFDEFEHVEIENMPARVMYNTIFFFLFKFPEATLKAFYKVITEELE